MSDRSFRHHSTAPEAHRITLPLATADNGISISNCDSGPDVEEFLGAYDCEFDLRIATDQVALLALHLIKDGFFPEADSVDALEHYYESIGMSALQWSWCS
ncbi:hypothetical protein [Rhizobium sp. CSW-27]|uniref:hypothetical protein n=1 Tax=Rhizobium sp. CSW-27 TaxID=2839985 RepID=UPI001C02B6F9|nr:hypothetical protein [Rhizobium sp. CSW-27]MBT9371566.1 hypothetical protein [Rhizobium sp. CSW-27]